MAAERNAVFRLSLISSIMWHLAPLLLASAPALAAGVVPRELSSCMNDGFIQQQSTFRDFALMRPTRLKLYKAWWSSKPPSVQVTVVTGLNPNRLEQLESQCRSWKGPISAAVYQVLQNKDRKDALTDRNQEDLAEVAGNIEAFHQRMEALDGCQLDIMLLYETVIDDIMLVLLPINTMRNYALLQARTPLVAMVDVDLIVSNTLYDWLKEDGNYQLLRESTRNKTVFVLPAFETAPQKNISLGHELADNASLMSKQQLKRLVDRRLIYQFALYLFRQGHNCTDYQKWFTAFTPYEVEYHDGYEPWFIIDRFANPFYDSVFRGYGWNKVTHVDNVQHQHFQFLAHPAGFLVHRQHGRSSADRMYQAQKKNYEADKKAGAITPQRPHNNLAGLTHRYRDLVLDRMANGTYSPLIDDGIKACVGMLPWWQTQSQQEGEQGQGQQPQQRRRRQRKRRRRQRRRWLHWLLPS